MAGRDEATFKFGTSGAREVKQDLASLRAELDKLDQARQRAEGGRQRDARGRFIGSGAGAGAEVTEEAKAAQASLARTQALRAGVTQLGVALTLGAGAATAFWGAIGDGALRAGRYAVDQAAALEQQIDKAAAVMAGGQLVRQQLEDAAVAAGAKSAFSAVQAGQALEFLAMAGFNARNATSALPGVLSLAAAGSVDLARAADLASNILTGYGFKAEELTKVNDVLVGTFTRSNVSLEQLGEAFKYVGPIAKASEQEFELMAAAIGRLGDAGIQGSQAGTTLRMGLIRLQDPPKRARVALEELGVQTKDASGRLLQLDEILGQLSKRGASVGQIARIFGAESAAGFAALLQQGPEQLRRFAEDLKAVEGLAKRIEQAKLDNLNGQLQIAQGGAETLAASLGKSLLPELTEVVKVTNDYLQSGKALTEVQRELTRTADEQQGSLSTLARDGLAVVNAAANRTATTLSALVYVASALASPVDTLGRLTGLWAVEAKGAGESARGLVNGLADVAQVAALTTAHLPVFGQALGVASVAMRTLGWDAAATAEAIQDATDKRRAEEMRAGWAILKDAGVATWRTIEGAALSYAAQARSTISEEDLRRAVEAEAQASKIALARADLRVAQARTAEERARAEAARERLKIEQEAEAGKISAGEADLKRAKISAELGGKLDQIRETEARSAGERAARLELAQLDLAITGQADKAARAQLEAERQLVQVRQQLAAGKLLDEEAAAKEAAIAAGLTRELDEIGKAEREQAATRAQRVELARLDLAITGQTDKAAQARLAAERELAVLKGSQTRGELLPEEEASKRAEIERKLQEDLKTIREEADEQRRAKLERDLGAAEQAASGLRGALSGLADDDPYTRAVAGLGEISAAALQTTLMLQAMETAEVGAGKAFVGAMQIAGPAVAAALGKMGVEQRALSGIKALFYAAEAVGQASLGNLVGAGQAGLAAALHTAVAAGAGEGGGGGGGGGGAGLAGAGAGASTPTFTPRATEDSQRQLARLIGEELDKKSAGGQVTVNFDFSGSVALDGAEGQRKIGEAAERGLRMIGVDVRRGRGG